MEETVNLQEILALLKKRILLIVSVLIGFISITALYTFFISTPQYEASTQILVNQSQEGEQPITANELQSNHEFINTYSVIITSPIILNQVIQETNVNQSVESLRNKITVVAENDSQVATLTVEDSDINTAVNLANSITNVFESEIAGIMAVDNVSILSEAQATGNESPISPQPFLNLLIASILGLVFGVILAFSLEFLDKSIKSEQDVEKILQLPLLGVIPTMNEQDITVKNKRYEKKNEISSNTNDKENPRKLS